MWRKIDAVHELAGLKPFDKGIGIWDEQGLFPVQQSGGGIERKPDRHILPNLMFAAAELRFREFANRDGVGFVAHRLRYRIHETNFCRLKIFQPRAHEVESVIRPVLIKEPNRMYFGAYGFVERLGPLLAEAEGRKIVDLSARIPPVPKIGLSGYVHARSAERLRRPRRLRNSAILDRIDHSVIIRSGPRFPAEIKMMSLTPRCVLDQTIGQIIAAANGPEITDAKHEPPAGGIAELRHKQSTPARYLLQRLVIVRRKEQRDIANKKCRTISNRALSGLDVEFRPLQPPPWIGHLAVCDKAVVQNVTIFQALGPLALKEERLITGKHPRPRINAGRCCAVYIIKSARFRIGVVHHPVRPELLVSLEIVEVDVAGRAQVVSFFVVLD